MYSNSLEDSDIYDELGMVDIRNQQTSKINHEQCNNEIAKERSELVTSYHANKGSRRVLQRSVTVTS